MYGINQKSLGTVLRMQARHKINEICSVSYRMWSVIVDFQFWLGCKAWVQ